MSPDSSIETGPTEPSGPTTRSYSLGFTDFPHALTVEAVLDAFNRIELDGDLATMHFDDGVPWQEALGRRPYDRTYSEWLDRKRAFIPEGHQVYLAVTPLNFERNGLALHRGEIADEPLQSPWNERTFDHPEVIEAYALHCERMIERYTPDFFAYAIEANMLFQSKPDDWPAFVRMISALYPALKSNHPELPIFITLQADFFHRDPDRQRAAIEQILPFTDMVALSTYPFTDQSDPSLLRGQHFTALAALAQTKAFAITETGWPAEDITTPSPAFIPGSRENQRIYVERLLDESDSLSAAFVSWFFSRDYDDLWDERLRLEKNAPIIRLWKDTGLYDGAGEARPALGLWRQALARPKR